jgi:hypothetical protein
MSWLGERRERVEAEMSDMKKQVEAENLEVKTEREKRRKQGLQTMIDSMTFVRQKDTGLIFGVCKSRRCWDNDEFFYSKLSNNGVKFSYKDVSDAVWASVILIPKELEPFVEPYIINVQTNEYTS